jgi:hypothetical protein
MARPDSSPNLGTSLRSMVRYRRAMVGSPVRSTFY